MVRGLKKDQEENCREEDVEKQYTNIIPIRLMVSMVVMAIVNLWLAYENEVDGIAPFLYIIGMIITVLWTGLIFVKKLIGVHALYLPVIIMVISFVCGLNYIDSTSGWDGLGALVLLMCLMFFLVITYLCFVCEVIIRAVFKRHL